MVGVSGKSFKEGAWFRESHAGVLNFRFGWGCRFGGSGMGKQRGGCKDGNVGQRIRKVQTQPKAGGKDREEEPPVRDGNRVSSRGAAVRGT